MKDILLLTQLLQNKIVSTIYIVLVKMCIMNRLDCIFPPTATTHSKPTPTMIYAWSDVREWHRKCHSIIHRKIFLLLHSCQSW